MHNSRKYSVTIQLHNRIFSAMCQENKIRERPLRGSGINGGGYNKVLQNVVKMCRIKYNFSGGKEDGVDIHCANFYSAWAFGKKI